MISEKAKNILWVEKYRPATIADCIVPDSTRAFFSDQAKTGHIQNMLLTGSHGIGKTTIARALCSEVGADVLFINCSKENSIDTVRTKIDSFASTMSLTGNKKVIIGDEFDYFSPAGQGSLRGTIEQVSNNCRFIFTCNYPSKVIDPLKSRLMVVNFKMRAQDKASIATQFMKRCVNILEAEGVEYEKPILAGVIQKHFPDFRKIVQDLQRAKMLGGLTVDFLETSAGEVGPYITALKEKDYKKASNWIGSSPIDSADFYTAMDAAVHQYLKDNDLASAIHILNEYQYKHAFVVDEELHLRDLTIQLMSNCKF